MHVMIATDGSLDPDKTTAVVARLAGETGRVTVISVVEVPREMLADMRHAAAQASTTTTPTVDVAYVKDRADDIPPTRWVGDDAIVASYVKRTVAARTSGLAAALDAAGVAHTVVGIEGENAARTVLESIATEEPDVVCVGTRGLGRFEGLLGSISTKIARLAPCSVMLVR